MRASEKLNELSQLTGAILKLAEEILFKNTQLQAENKRLREILAREVDDGRAEVDDIGVEAWIDQALKQKETK